MSIERKLAAIMFTDIADYTALSAKDSLKTSELLKTQKDTLKPIVEKHGGSGMKEIGDGFLLTFASATSASDYLKNALKYKKGIDRSVGAVIYTNIYLYCTYNKMGKEYDDDEIIDLIKVLKNTGSWWISDAYELQYHIYELLEDLSYLETAYSQVQELADNIEPYVAAKFLSYPIPSAIIEEWEKVK